ncbi:hypothetical protein RND81_05G125300 [Saponaria officinalis]|uniref:PROP1-like PPR domain-containing protein n=1 Tax=Saponaria officinalis TaxID=3572 RepID=A0AAW1L087_SAPOF
MATLKLQHSNQLIPQNPQFNPKNTTKNPTITQLITTSSPKTRTLTITCGLRNMGPKKPLWRSSVLSTEAIQAVHALKLAKCPTKLDLVFDSRLSRLLKVDLLDTLCELQRQNELDLALKVFEFAKNESWYRPNLDLYYDMILLLGKNKQIEKAEQLFNEMKKEGLEPDTRAYTELIGAYFQASMVEKAMETYTQMKASGCIPDKLTLMIMVRNMEKAGREDLSASVKRDFEEYVDEPEQFLEQVERKYARDPLVTV